MVSTPNVKEIYRERLSYEILLLKHIDKCTSLRYSNAESYIACVSSLWNILIKDIREGLENKLRNDDYYKTLVKIDDYLRSYDPYDSNLDELSQLINDIKRHNKIIAEELLKLLDATNEYRERIKKELFVSSPNISDLKVLIGVARSDIVLSSLIDTLNELGLLLKHKDMYRGVVP